MKEGFLAALRWREGVIGGLLPILSRITVVLIGSLGCVIGREGRGLVQLFFLPFSLTGPSVSVWCAA